MSSVFDPHHALSEQHDGVASESAAACSGIVVSVFDELSGVCYHGSALCDELYRGD